jgi:hypothetical protein
MASEFDRLVDEAAKHIQESKHTIRMPTHLAIAGVTAGSDVSFCKLWPGIRSALEAFKAFLPWWAGWAADLLIRIGNKACPK